MKIHHLNCGSLCPMCAQFLNRTGGWFRRGEMVCHCFLIETNAGLILVDTGFGTHDIQHSNKIGFGLRFSGRPALAYEETAIAQVEALGFRKEDVRHIIATHLDLDHAGGLPDFPNAKVHVHRREFERSQNLSSYADKQRSLPHQWAHEVKWELYEETGESWFGFDAVRSLNGISDDILLIPLFGHTVGHVGVAVNRGDDWILHCGDAYFYKGAVDPENPHRTIGSRLIEWALQQDQKQRLGNLNRLQNLSRDHGHEVDLICAHDPADLKRCIE